MSALLEVEDVSVRFPMHGALPAVLAGSPRAVEAVAGVSVGIRAGETFALVGESGSGKTTLARAIAGLVAIERGSIRFEGRELAGLGDAALRPVRRHIGMMFQDPVGSLSPRLTVRSILREPFRIHSMTGSDLNSRVETLLARVGLAPAFGDRYPHQLSGGQARRVGVARAIALDPKLLIADEPTAGLDVSIQGGILNLLRALKADLGIALLIITHNLSIVRHIADRMAIMYLGRIVEAGPTEAVFARPRHPYTLALLSATPEPDPDAAPRRVALEGEIPSLLHRPKGCEFHTRCPFAADRCRAEAPSVTRESAEHLYTCHFPR
jgi:oligopeptide/dipeptide ABC transporter ATP-binding protein